MLGNHHYVCILAGGVGTRLWPISTPLNPKQFAVKNEKGRSLFQQTYSRARGLVDAERIFVLTNIGFLSFVQEELPEISRENIFCENAMRNTAPAIALANAIILKKDPKAVVFVTPSDHFVRGTDAFLSIVRQAMHEAEDSQNIFTFGKRPGYAHTGYGYIETEAPGADGAVLSFREKPDEETAKGYIAKGNYLWNTGLFVWSSRWMHTLVQQLLPQVFTILEEHTASFLTTEQDKAIAEFYPTFPNISIDYAIMEKAEGIQVKYLSGVEWDDLGTYHSLQDTMGSYLGGVHQVHEEASANNFVYAPENIQVILHHMQDIAVIHANGKLVVLPTNRLHLLKQISQDITS